MRVCTLSRTLLLGGPVLPLAPGRSYDPQRALRVLDRYGLPDGYPFVLEDDGSIRGCRHLNLYLLDAWGQRGLSLETIRKTQFRFLIRFLLFLRARHLSTDSPNSPPHHSVHWDEIPLDLTDATRDDLFAYRAYRLGTGIKASTLNNELAALSAFYRYAVERSWITADPVPRWGVRKRNTLVIATREQRIEKFLTLPQAKHFLDIGLRGDGVVVRRPAYPERDYSFGLLMLSTGMRREEAGNVLDCELSPLGEMPSSGVTSFRRTGKYRVTRDIYTTTELLNGMHLYRTAERPAILAAAQPSLRRRLRAGHLLIVDRISSSRGQASLLVSGRSIPCTSFNMEDRRRAVRIADDGTIEPLALFLSRIGLPLHVDYWDHLFADARRRVHANGSPLRPPAHVNVTPHTMRHTFAVHCLSELIRSSQGKALDPYALIKNPVETVRQLLGHASIETTQKYLYAAEIWEKEAPSALRRMSEAATSGINDPETLTGLIPGPAS